MLKRTWLPKNIYKFFFDFFFSEDTSNLGSRFSKSSSEREKILYRRKEHMIQGARKRYIEKQKAAATAKEELQSWSVWKKKSFKKLGLVASDC